ncbi:MAG: hypothetical protein QM706_01375 [Nitrospira sp.]
MSEYTPSRLSAWLVPLSAIVSILITGIYGAALYVDLIGIDPHKPLGKSLESWFVVISTLVVTLLGFVLGLMVWAILLSIILPSNAARYWARYPSPNPLFEKLNEYILNIRRRKLN